MSAAIIHPTDFSDLSLNAFAYALRISLAAKCRLFVAHIAARGDASDWEAFPHVREMLARWGLIDSSAPVAAVFHSLGIEVVKVEIGSDDPANGLARFLAGHPSQLMVLATHARDGLARWLEPSVAEAMARRARTRTLFIPARGVGFVECETGTLRLERILMPVDHRPVPVAAIAALQKFCLTLGTTPEIRFLHVGTEAPTLAGVPFQYREIPVEVRRGNVVETIIDAAADMDADLIAMATAGHEGVLDAVRGSTTERVLRQAPCPVLAIPVDELA